MKLFDFEGYGGTPAVVPLSKVQALTVEGPSSRDGCHLWVVGSDEPFVVTEPFGAVRQRLADAKEDKDG